MLTGPAQHPHMNHVGDTTYLPLQSNVVIAAPTSNETGKPLTTTDPKESEKRLVYQEKKFTLRPVFGSSKDAKTTPSSTTQRKLSKPKMVVFSTKLKTNSKPRSKN